MLNQEPVSRGTGIPALQGGDEVNVYPATVHDPAEQPSPRWWGQHEPALVLDRIRHAVAHDTARALRVPLDRVQIVEHRAPSGISVQAVYWPGP